MIHKPVSSKLARYARRHTSDAAKAKKAAKRQDEDAARLRWLMIRVAVFDRDKGRCRVCGKRVYLSTLNPFTQMHAHHLRFRSAGGSDALDNLIALCGWPCHDEVHRHLVSIDGTAEDFKVVRHAKDQEAQFH